MLCISLAVSSNWVWCAEAREGMGVGWGSTLHVCNLHKEIVSGRSSPINSFLACQPSSYPTSQRWAVTSNHIYFFLDSLNTHTSRHLPPPQTHTFIFQYAISARRHTFFVWLAVYFPTFVEIHSHMVVLPKWLAWDSNADSDGDISTCWGRREHHRETAAGAALTAAGLPKPEQTALLPLLPRCTQAGKKHFAGCLPRTSVANAASSDYTAARVEREVEWGGSGHESLSFGIETIKNELLIN